MKYVDIACDILHAIVVMGKDPDEQSINRYVTTKEVFSLCSKRHPDISHAEVNEVLNAMWVKSILTKRPSADTAKLLKEKSPLFHEKTREITDDTGWRVGIDGKNGGYFI